MAHHSVSLLSLAYFVIYRLHSKTCMWHRISADGESWCKAV